MAQCVAVAVAVAVALKYLTLLTDAQFFEKRFASLAPFARLATQLDWGRLGVAAPWC